MRLLVQEKRFPGAPVAALADIDVTLDDGSLLALLGPSGAGKTTLLRLLAGIDRDFRGELQRVNEHGAPSFSPLQAIGFMFQEPRLMPWLTVAQNVALVVGGDRERAQAALQSVAMQDTLDLYPHQLSGGMQRRVALARAIVGEPRLLLLDEPFVSLDQPSALQLQELLLRHWEKARPTIVLVSHNLDEAMVLADRLLFLGGAPASIIYDCRIATPRPRQAGAAALLEEREALLKRHPQLLSGALGGVD